MSWMSLSWSEHLCQDDDGGGASLELPEVDDADAADEAATAKLWRVEENAQKKKAESYGSLPSWLRRQKAQERSGTGWPLRAASPV